jgi:hypothetical protein
MLLIFMSPEPCGARCTYRYFFGIPVITQVEKIYKKEEERKRRYFKGIILEKNAMPWKLKIVPFKK